MEDLIIDFLHGISANKSITREEVASADLVTSGVLDSLGIFQVISFVETKIGVSVTPAEMTFERFRNVTSIIEFMSGKCGTVMQ